MLRKENFGEREMFELCLKRDDNMMIFLFRFIYLGEDEGPINATETSCTLMIHGITTACDGFFLTVLGNAVKHPKDEPNWRIGARLSAKRAIGKISDDAVGLLGVSKKELYRAVREAMPTILDGIDIPSNPDPTNQP